MIWIRADANKEIGSGHVMRCLSVAAALQECGEEVCFIVADEGAEALLKDRGQAYRILHSAYDDMDGEWEQLDRLFQEQRPGLVLVDSYFATRDYLRRLRERVKTVYMDDVPRFAYPVDMVINYNIYGDSLPYMENAAEERQECLLGVAYAPLREQFQNSAYEVRPKAENVLVTTGGSDKYNLAGQILESVLRDDRTGKLHYHVVSGAFNPHYPVLEALAEEHGNIHLYRNVSDMAGLMKRCDVAISAGGSTMYELCAVGVPTLCFSFVDNQEQIVATFLEKGLVAYGGNYLVEKEAFAGKVTKALAMLAGSVTLRQQYSQKERQLVDGQGVRRIAQALIHLADNK